MSFTELSCREFVSALSSKSPVPGGGGASAYVGAIGSALGNMVGSLTVGKKKYADVEKDIISLMDRMTSSNELPVWTATPKSLNHQKHTDYLRRP